MKNNETIKMIREVAITKRLNFLIGSGASAMSIGTMEKFKDVNSDSPYDYEAMIDKVKDVSSHVLELKEKRKEEIDKAILKNLIEYKNFISAVINILNCSNSRQTPKSVNIFTTNYDLFIENAVDFQPKSSNFMFNDGANGYFERCLNSFNYNQVVSHKGLNDNYISEIPSISLIKPHGSVNWEQKNEEIIIRNSVVDNPVYVKPNGLESQETFLNNHFHEMLRVFQIELDKPQSVVFVVGFSFQDKHIKKMITRALRNPELIVFVFAYNNVAVQTIKNNLNITDQQSNLKIIGPKEIGCDVKNIGLKELTQFLSDINFDSTERNYEE